MSDGAGGARAAPRPAVGRHPAPKTVGREGFARRAAHFSARNRNLLERRLFWSVLGRAARMRLSGARAEPALQRFVVCHHKGMTTYFSPVLQILSLALSGRFAKIPRDLGESEGRDFILYLQGGVDFARLGAYRGVHVLRDPRDMIVSGYHYHQWCDERWAHRPDDAGRSYQQKLREASKEDGLFMEIDLFAHMNAEKLRAWPLGDPDLLEVSYETLMGPEREAAYGRIFDHLRLDGEAGRLGRDLMRLFEAGRRRGRRAGAVSERAHLRSGRSGQWREELSEAHIRYINETLGDVLEKFGYAP